jgi:NTE family protein
MSDTRRAGGAIDTAFVLGGGGNLGAVQVGMLRALTEAGITADAVYGCSVGAMNGAGYATEPGMRTVERLEELWRGLPAQQIMGSGLLPTALRLARKGEAAQSSDGLRAVIDAALEARRFDELAIPFECVATAIDEATEVWFSEGELAPAILASGAMPGIYPPVVIDGVRYMDGAVVNDIPISRAVEAGATRLYVLHVGSFERPRREAQRPLDVFIDAYWIARRHRFQRDLAALPGQVEAIVLPTGGPPKIPFNDFSRSAEMMANSYRASSERLAVLSS